MPPRILITRPRAQASNLATSLEAAGAQAIFLPVIAIRPLSDLQPLDLAIQRLERYAWVIFTSTNAVEIFASRLAANPAAPSAALGTKVHLAAVGPKTAAALQARGLQTDFVPGEYTGTAIVPGLGDLKDQLVLYPCAELAGDALPSAIVQAGGIVHTIAIYETIPETPDTHALSELCAGVDAITFTSPSSVHNFCTLTRQAGLDPLALPGNPLVACIGPRTAAAAKEAGFQRCVIANEYNNDGLVDVLRSARLLEGNGLN